VKAKRTSAMPRRQDPQRARAALAERLDARRAELERAATTRAHAIADPKEAADPAYAEGLRMAVAAAIDYGIASIEQSQARPPLVPAALLAQARIAARNGITLDTVLRRYFAGYTLFVDFLLGEAHGDESVSSAELKHILRAQAANFDRLVAAVSEEHARETSSRLDSTEERRAELVGRLLAGELVEASELAYDFEGWHLGIVATGHETADVIRDIGRSLDRRVLIIREDHDMTRAWLGGRRRLEPDELIAELESRVSGAQVWIAVGEPGESLDGWRLSHRQALAALAVALRGEQRPVRYRDVALLASVLQEELLAMSLRELYLVPLAQERDGGASARETLRSYFGTGRNISSTAASLGVSRNTVANRLCAIEEAVGQSITSCASALEIALFMHELQD
jgi:GGDEF-like domain/PucR C-terminal helix-turn-helix domain